MIYIGADHGGFKLKEELKAWLISSGQAVEDLGSHSFEVEDDYPDFIIPVGQKVTTNPGSLGIILGRSGNGEAIAANKVKGVRAVVCLTEEMAKKAKEHNNANILSIGADYIDPDQVKAIVETFLKTPFSNEERHLRRLQKIADFENSH